jgi:hypothetical protein
MEIGRIQRTDVPSSATLKNLGLGYMYMVRSKVHEFPSDIAIPFISIVDDGSLSRFNKIWYDKSVEADWKTWASLHWKYYWGSFLNHTDSKSDPSYNQVKSIYDAVLNTAGKKNR